MKKVTTREYKMAGAFTLVIGSFLLAVSLGFPGTPNPGTPKPLALIALSAMPVLFGLISLLTRPTRSVLILGPASLAIVFLAFMIADGILFPKVRIWWNADNPQAIASLEPHAKTPDVVNTKSLGMTFKEISAGTFLMGSPESEPDRQSDEHQHKITISKAFYMQTTEVTKGQWTAMMGTEPWKYMAHNIEDPNAAATWVTWNDAVAFCKKLSHAEGKTYRLPTEAEWEYACRAGTKTTWSFGNDENKLGDYAWYNRNAKDIGERYPHQVGLKKSNPFGLYDMHGNVSEYCHDYYERDYYKQSPEQDPQGPASGSYHVLRGGTWHLPKRRSRSADRDRPVTVIGKSNNLGFRVVRELD